MAEREKMALEVLTVQGWYRGEITLPIGGRLLDYLNTKAEIIALTDVIDPGGAVRPFVGINTSQILAIRPAPPA